MELTFLSEMRENDVSEFEEMNDILANFPSPFGTGMWEREDFKFRQYKPIRINKNILLSIQASVHHHASPKRTIALEEYTAMEIAIIRNGREFVKVTDVAPDFPYLDLIERYEDTVYSCVPVELIEELFRHFKNGLMLEHKKNTKFSVNIFKGSKPF